MSVTSEEVNFLVYRYLQESGFVHSAFSFFNESTIPRTSINGANVPTGALISYIQKGLLYTEMESHLNEDGTETKCDAPFSLVVPHNCNVVDKDVNITDDVEMIQENEITELKGHTNSVYQCVWNPKKPILSTGSTDSTSILWSIDEDLASGPELDSGLEDPIVLPHKNRQNNNSNNNSGQKITSLSWTSDGNILATGCDDGAARIWSSSGELKSTLVKHQAPIFSLKWNKRSDLLVTGSLDKTTIVWDKSGEIKRQYSCHNTPVIDVDWKDNTVFASGGVDKLIYVCDVSKQKPLKKFQGHVDDINVIRWNKDGSVLASCSDDFTTKLWKLNNDKPIHDFKTHKKEVCDIQWNPTNNNMLASASFDSTVKLWDIETGKSIHNLTTHTEPVYTLSFSPDGRYIASGSSDTNLHIWSTNDGSLVQTLKTDGIIYQVGWNKDNRIAAGLSNKHVIVLDVNL